MLAQTKILTAFFVAMTIAGCASKQIQVPPTDLKVEEVRDEAGKLIETKSYYIDAVGKQVLHGPYIHYHDNGQKQIEVTFQNGRRDGTLTEWGLAGDKEREEHYKNDLREGPSISWYSRDKLTSQCIFKHDKIIGRLQVWYQPGGQLELEETHDRDGNLTEQTQWYENGQKKSQGKFNGVWSDQWGGSSVEGKRDGVWTYWDNAGNVTAQGTWKAGKPWEGTCIVPKESGSLFVGEVGTYHQGQLVGDVKTQPDF